MRQDSYPFFKKAFSLPRNEGENKVITLREALQRYLKPGYKIHISRDAGASASEIVRQYWRTNPGFTLITSVFTGNLLNLFFSSLLSRIITSNISHIFPSPSPVKGIIEAHEKGLIKIESWSLFTLQQRLMAGAMGLSFIPAPTISGTSLIQENHADYKEIEDPFNEGKRVGIISSLRPDISFVHASAADSYGNAILPVPYEDNIWGPRASREGVILTTERLATTGYIRAHSTLARLPGYMVKSVSLAPLGSHPMGLYVPGIKENENYAIDYDFLSSYRKASQRAEDIEKWIKEWVLECPDQQAYLKKLGMERINSLKKRALHGKQKSNLESLQISHGEATPGEWMTISAYRKIMEKVLARGYRTILAGIGTSALAAWMAYYFLREKGYGLDILTGAGQVGFSPGPGDPGVGNISANSTCKMITDSIEAYGTIVGGPGNKCLSILGTAQIDRYGNLNTSMINGSFFIGAGGATDAMRAQEAMVVAKASRNRLLPDLHYISSSGSKVCSFASQLGIMEKIAPDEETSPSKNNELVLTSYFKCPPGLSAAEIIENIKRECGWELNISPRVKEEPPPTEKELWLLRALDPQALFTNL